MVVVVVVVVVVIIVVVSSYMFAQCPEILACCCKIAVPGHSDSSLFLKNV